MKFFTLRVNQTLNRQNFSSFGNSLIIKPISKQILIFCCLCYFHLSYLTKVYFIVVNSFCKNAIKHAKEMARENQDPIDLEQSIKKVALELHEGHRTPFASTFGDRRATVFNSLKGNVKVEEIFELAESNAECEAKKKFLNSKEKEKHMCKHGNRVLITGQAGIGKSTLSRIICQKIIDKKMLPEMRYIFYIKCRDIDFGKKLDLFEFLSKHGLSNAQEFQPDEKEHVIKTIDESRQVVIIFDGMDEAQSQDFTKSNVPKCRLKDIVEPSVIIRSLMNSNLLPKAKVLVTCRPRQAYRFSPEYTPGAVIQILGLNVESQKKLGKQICKDNFSATYNIIRKDEDLESACYISVFCVILYAVLKSIRSAKFQLSSITTVMVYLLDRYFRSAHMRNVELSELKKISELARKGFTQRRLVFDPNIIGEVGLTQAALQAFTVTYVDEDTKLKLRIFGAEERCCFSHFIWQEFFTAIDLLFFAPAEIFDECLECITSNDDDHRWEVVTKFMFGLTNQATHEYIQMHLISKAQKTQWAERKQLLWTSSQVFVNRQVQDSVRLVQICNWLQEVDDYSFTEKLVSKFPETFKLSGNDSLLILLHHDVRSILRLLQFEMEFSKQSRKIKNIDFDNIKFSRDTFRNFASNMSNRSTKVFK